MPKEKTEVLTQFAVDVVSHDGGDVIQTENGNAYTLPPLLATILKGLPEGYGIIINRID